MSTDDANELAHFGSVRGLPDLPAEVQERFVSRYVEVDGVRLHVVIGGTGTPVLLVGGWPQFWWQWRYVLGPLSQDRTVIAVDPRGVGLSDRPATGYDTATVAAELQRLMAVLGHEQFAVLGHDVGAWIAYAMAADYPDHISQVALIDAALPGISAAPSALPHTQREVDATWHFLFNRLAALNEHLIEGREDAYLNAQFLIKAANRDAMPPATIDIYIQAQRQPGALRGSLAYYRALDETIPQNQDRAQHQLGIPVLAIGGAASRGEIIAHDAQQIASDVTGVSIPDCGHYVAEEAPGALIRELRDFLGAIPPHTPGRQLAVRLRSITTGNNRVWICASRIRGAVARTHDDSGLSERRP